MINLSMEKKKYLEDLLDLVIIQEEIIAKEDVEGLENLLNRKDKLMGSIDEIDKKFLLSYESIKKIEGVKSFENLDGDKYPNLKNLKDIIKDINNLLNTIDIKEKNNISKMKENLEKTKSDLKQIKEVKRAYKGYNYEEAGSILIDENR